MATGWHPYPLENLTDLGGGVLPDVITNVTLERLASATGPTAGKILRPSDGEAPQRVAFSSICRHPDVFSLAVAMSGTYDLSKYLEGRHIQDFYFASPLHFLPGLEGPILEQLRKRLILLPSGEGDFEDIGESWRIGNALGAKGIPNRVDSWGSEWRHDWVTWRAMLPKYLAEFAD